MIRLYTSLFLEAMDKGRKDDNGKNRLDLILPKFIEDVGQVLTFGAQKYGPNNWQQLEHAVDRYYAATLRHLIAWREGEATDTESGLPHLAHVATNVMFLLYLTEVD